MTAPMEVELSFRAIEEEDLETVRAWRMSPEVTRYMNTDPVLTEDGQLAWLAAIRQDASCKYWIVLADGVKIGVVSLSEIDSHNRRCTMGWYIGETAYRGKGLGKRILAHLLDYVFNNLELNRLYVSVLSENTHAIDRVYLPIGFEREGALKEHIWKNGRFHDIVVLGITANRWQQLHAENSKI